MSPKCDLACLLFLFTMVTSVKDEHIEFREIPRDLDFHKKGERETIEIVGDKLVKNFVETLTNSERYLKMIETVKRKLSQLDKRFNEKWSKILEHVAETLHLIKMSVAKVDEAATDSNLSSRSSGHLKIHTGFDEDMEIHGDRTLDGRLSSMENLIRHMMSSVESIVTTISDVKNGQNAKTLTRSGLVVPMDSANLMTEFRRIMREQRQKECKCSTSVRTDLAERYPTDCYEILMQGFNVSGIYKIKPDDTEPFYILCDLTTARGGWTVFQKRYDGSQDFFKGWLDYKYGFGNLAGEFWIGLEKLAYLTNQKLYELRVELESQHGHKAYASYSVFSIGPEHEGYRISTLGMYSGTAGDSLSYHAGQKFSTPDVDHDEWKDGSCSIEHGGAWWYKECDKSNLNGKFAWKITEENRGKSIYWISFKELSHAVTKTKMMLRPLPASKPSS